MNIRICAKCERNCSQGYLNKDLTEITFICLMDLNAEELVRYGRHLAMREFGKAEQIKLKKAAVLVIGAGGLGSPVLLYLTAAGVGKIGIVEFDNIDLSNLQRQVLYTTDQIGESKNKAAKSHLKKINPNTEIISYNEPLTSTNARAIMREYDVVVDGTDNFPTRYLVNDACILENKPNVYGSVLRFEGQVSVFNQLRTDGTRGPNYRDLYPVPPPPELAPNCSEAGVLGVLPGIIGSMQANEVIKILTGLGEPLDGRVWIFDALSFESRTLRFKKSNHPPIKALIDYESFCGVQSDLINEIDPLELAALRARMDALVIVDVREKEEYEIDNLGIENIPLSTLKVNLDAIDSNNPLLVHCQSGQRSKIAITTIKKRYPEMEIYNLTGGLNNWRKTFGTRNLSD